MTSPERVLIVDDNPVNRKILLASLGKAGYETESAVNGADAVAKALEWEPDLVLLDVDMPELDGFDVCQILKSNEDTADTPIIFLTAMTGVQDLERAFAVGGSDYVTKPFHMAEVKARVSVHLHLRNAIKALETQHVQLLHAQKLESIGQLAAGIAHEINTPTQYIGDNTRFLRTAFGKLLPLLEEARSLAERLADDEAVAEHGTSLRDAFRASKFDFLSEQIPSAIDQSLEGIGRVTRIVGAMKDFSHPGPQAMTPVDLNRAIESTITVASNEWKYVAEVETELDPELPPVPCLPGELNQVVLNLIVNGAHAIADVVGDGSAGKGVIKVSTRCDGEFAEIRIADTGTGIPVEARNKIFDPFFTTKEVGKGTGQGLSIAHDVVVHRHKGKISFDTELGRGTTFIIRLPLSTTKAKAEEVAA